LKASFLFTKGSPMSDESFHFSLAYYLRVMYIPADNKWADPNLRISHFFKFKPIFIKHDRIKAWP
jgi:hypothetical protein